MKIVTRKRVVWLAVLAVAGGGLAAYLKARSSQPKALPRFETVKVDRGRIVGKVTATGTLSARVTVQVGSQVSGRLAQILVDYNSEVKKGDVLARIDPQFYLAAREQARANAIAARGNLQKAEVQSAEADRQFRRAQALAGQKLVSQADLDTAQANADAARAQVAASRGAVAQAQAALHQAEVNLEYTTILSPIDGVVISRNVDEGQTVAATFQAPTLFVLAQDLSRMQVDTNVAEADVGKLQPKMAATFRVDAYPGETFPGTVRQIRKSPLTVQNIVTYDAVINVDNPDLKLMPGMTANVTFTYAERDDVLRVPNAALRYQPTEDVLKAFQEPAADGAGEAKAQGGPLPGMGPPPPPDAGRKPALAGNGSTLEDASRRTVWLLRDGRPVAAQIRTGITDGSTTEVTEGDVKAGDALVVDATIPITRSPFRMH